MNRRFSAMNFAICSLLIICSSIVEPFPVVPTLISTGSSQQFKSEDGIGNYNFGYDENHHSGGTFRRESGHASGVKSGSYGLREADGRIRMVNYIADAAGFRASISTNEPGTVSSYSGGALLANPAASAFGPPAVHAARRPSTRLTARNHMFTAPSLYHQRIRHFASFPRYYY